MSIKERVFKLIQDRREKILNGGINSIPSPFARFRNDFLGLEQGNYIVVTASTKVGKTQITSYLVIYNSILYAYNNPDKLRVKIFMFPLEETQEDVTLRFMSFLLFHLYQIIVSPTDLKSTKNDKPLPQEIIDKMNTPEYQSILDFFLEHITFSTVSNPTGIYKEVLRYAEDNGTIHTKLVTIKDDFGQLKNLNTFDYYEPNDPDEYVFIIVDHASLVNTEKGMTQKQAMDKLSEYFVLLRNRFKYSPVLVIQQAAAAESLESFKENKLRPSLVNLSDSKYSSRDANVVLGLFSPYRHELKTYMGYDIINKFKDNIRFLEVLINRNGTSGGLCPLFFDGRCCYYKELPLPNDTNEIQKVYKYLDKIRGTTTAHLFLLLGKKKNRVNVLSKLKSKFKFAALWRKSWF